MNKNNLSLGLSPIPKPDLIKDKEIRSSLEARNKSCHAGREADRINHLKVFISDEIKDLQEDYHSLSLAEDFLTYYQEALSGSEEAPKELPWFPLMTMLLELLKGVQSLEDADVLEMMVEAFLSSARSIGYEEVNGGKDE